MSTLDTRTDDFAQRLQRFSGLLDESLDAETTALLETIDARLRARDV